MKRKKETWYKDGWSLDITKDYVEDAMAQARKEKLPAEFLHMDIMSADYADTHFPCNLWDSGEKGITLSRFEWERESKIMLYGQKDFAYGDVLTSPYFESGDPIRLYHINEIKEIMRKRNMEVRQVFGKFDGTLGNENEIQMIVCSEKLNT